MRLRAVPLLLSCIRVCWAPAFATPFPFPLHLSLAVQAMVVNHPAADTEFTRIVEYKHVPNQPKAVREGKVKGTLIAKEVSSAVGDPYYPVRSLLPILTAILTTDPYYPVRSLLPILTAILTTDPYCDPYYRSLLPGASVSPCCRLSSPC